MVRNFFLSLFIVFIFALSPLQSSAEAVLFFAPTRVDISDQNPIQEVRVTNTSSSPKSYTLSVHDLVMTESGVTTRVDGFDYSAKRMIRFVPRQFDIAPGKTQIVRIMARISPATEDGQFHSHLEFLENVQRSNELVAEEDTEAKARMKAQIAYATAIPVTLTKGEIKTQLDISDLDIRRNERGQYMLSMVLGRSGNGQGNALINTDYIAPDGTVTKAAAQRPVYIYREIDKRNHSFVLELLDGVELQKGGQILVKLFNQNVSVTDPVKEMKLSID
tara:strand:+ start:7637 stop:8464 length:828 start_codon:yes stop_codon:yes gene_type:complete